MDGVATPLSDRVAASIGADRIRAPIGIEAAAAELIVEPAEPSEICELVRLCESDHIALAPVGAARTLSQIRRRPVALGVSLKRIARIVAYEPDDMTIVAEAGATVGQVNAATAAARQRLPVDPCRPALMTLGSLVGAAHAGPLRLSEGTARDLLIGVRFVGHGGRTVHGGGRVVKNVAGYDLMKVMGGSFGTLGIITETTFKVRPIPSRYCLAVAPYDRAADAFAVATSLNDALPLSHVEVVSPALAEGFGIAEKFVLLAGFSGSPEEVGYQAEKIRQLAGDSGDIFDDDRAHTSYEILRDLDFLSATLSAQIATPPAMLAKALEAIGVEFRAHAGSGVAQIFVTGESAGDARTLTSRWRQAARANRGHVRLLSAASSVRDGLEFFDTPNDGALKLMRRLKAAFDPSNIFNPGCFVGGI